MMVGESSNVHNGRRRNIGSATALDVMGAPAAGAGTPQGGSNTPSGRSLGQAQLSQPLPSPQGGVVQRSEHSSRTEYGSAFYRDGISSPKDHVLTKNAAERIRRTSEHANSPTGLGHKQSPSSPLPLLGGKTVSASGQPPAVAAVNVASRGAARVGSTDRHSDSPRSPAAASPASPLMFGIPPTRVPSSGPGPSPFSHQSPDVSPAFRMGGGGGPSGRPGGIFDSRGVAAALSGNVSTPVTTPAHSNNGRGRTSMAPAMDQEANLGEAIAGYGSWSLQGLRDYQEDALGFLHSGDTLAGGVFDGHGGDQVSRELERCLLQNIVRGINEISTRDPGPMGPSPASIQAAIAKAYTQTNQEIGARLHNSVEAGSCAVTFIMTRAAGVLHLFCANAGDCRAVLCTGTHGNRKSIRLSEDHKPVPHVCPSEIARVSAAGGCVLWGRVQGCLAVSRAFGDKALHPYVIADPYISVRPLNPDQDAFLYLSSDGVTDMVDDTTGCQVVSEALAKGQSAAQAAQALCNAAYQKGSSDNISAIVVRLRKR